MRKIIAGLVLVAALSACSAPATVSDSSRQEASRLAAELNTKEEQVADLTAEVAALKREVERVRSLGLRAVEIARRQRRTINLYKGCMQDIIDETGRVYNVFQYAPALRVAFNGANCSALGYYWG
jgi:cell division protein FtsB